MLMRSRNARRETRAGFTLIEVIVAMTISAMILIGARAMLGEVGDDVLRIRRDAETLDRDANAERTFRGMVDRIELGSGEGNEFAGDPARASFSTWCDVPAGWMERCRVSIDVERIDNKVAIVALPSIGGPVVLREGLRIGALRYLVSAEGGGSWLTVWGAGITAPLAIGVIAGADTLIVPIGERG
jgi:prepilin-type N-terminal cleavage/methylation domain-containing protein